MLDAKSIHAVAHAAGMTAGQNAVPHVMNVYAGNQLVDSVSDGVCGFAWVHFKGNTAFGRAMKSAGLARADYPKGLCVWVSEFGQSMTRKMAYAQAYAKVLREEYGIADAYPQSRMD